MEMGPIQAAVVEPPRAKNRPLMCVAGLCVLVLLVPYWTYLAARILAAAIYRGLCCVGEVGLQELSAGAKPRDR